jgi:hypothetical protein
MYFFSASNRQASANPLSFPDRERIREDGLFRSRFAEKGV